jgi:RNA polymerase sigma factor (sigma-70 family)
MAERPRDQALVELVRNRGEALVRYAFLLTGDVAGAQDVVQDALVKVFVRLRARPAPEYLEAYVRRAIATVYIDGYRRHRRWVDVQHLLAPEAAHPAPDADTRFDLHQALATLAPQERVAVVLRYFGDLTVPEVAENMGLAPGTVKRYLSNAIGKLERQLGPMPSLSTEDREVLTIRQLPSRGRG